MTIYNDDYDAETHAADLSLDMASLIQRKYAAGQAEHGGKLWRKNLELHILSEVIDLAVYVLTLREQLHAVRIALADAIYDFDKGETMLSKVIAAYNILTQGNPEGIEEREKSPDDWMQPKMDEAEFEFVPCEESECQACKDLRDWVTAEEEDAIRITLVEDDEKTQTTYESGLDTLEDTVYAGSTLETNDEDFVSALRDQVVAALVDRWPTGKDWDVDITVYRCKE